MNDQNSYDIGSIDNDENVNDDGGMRWHQEVGQHYEESFLQDMMLQSMRDFAYDCRAVGCDVMLDRLVDFLLSKDQMNGNWWEHRNGHPFKVDEQFRHDALLSALGNAFVKVKEARKSK